MSGYYKHDPEMVDGRCVWPWVDKSGADRVCNSTQRSSVMHYDAEAEFRQMHDHGGGDCMCFESGPETYYDAMARFAKEYRRGYQR
jgi:hypothetical protein